MQTMPIFFFIFNVVFSPYLTSSEIHAIEKPIPQSESLIIDHSYDRSPFPIGTLDPQILDEFIPLIMEEVAGDFSHQNDTRTHRDTRQYGFNFFKMLSGDFSYEPPPQFYQKLAAHICEALGHEPIEFTNIILSLYEKDFHLEPHVDVNIKNLYGNAPFYFGERVYGIIIEPDLTGHLYFAKWEEDGLVPPIDIEPTYTLIEQKGTIFCLEGDFRQTPYFHAVSSVSNHRISITFRTVEKIFIDRGRILGEKIHDLKAIGNF